MKRLIFFEILRRFKSAPALKRKLKIFLVVGVVGFFVTSALVIWAGIAGVRYVANLAQDTSVTTQVESLKHEVREMPALMKVGCWDKAQSLIGVEPWLERPIADNFRNLKVACLGKQEPLCKGAECDAIKRGLSTAEKGETI